MKYYRISFYFLLFLFLVIPFVPLPFPKPRIIHDLFSQLTGGLLLFSVSAVLVLCGLVLFVWFVVASLKARAFKKALFWEFLLIPVGFLLFALIIMVTNKVMSAPEVIVSINQNRAPEDFVNPYLGFQMIDCRDLGDQYDVVFIPSHLAIEVDYLAYAPRRLDKSIGDYRYAQKYGDDWYWEFSGSQWRRDLFNCVNRNRAPNS